MTDLPPKRAGMRPSFLSPVDGLRRWLSPSATLPCRSVSNPHTTSRVTPPITGPEKGRWGTPHMLELLSPSREMYELALGLMMIGAVLLPILAYLSERR